MGVEPMHRSDERIGVGAEMKDEFLCEGHFNGFEHLPMEGFEGKFDVGVKFQREDPPRPAVDPITGIKAWPGPVLVLYVSVADKESADERKTLRYGLECAQWASPLTPSPENRWQLIERMKPDLEILRSGGQPDSLRQIVMV